MKPFSILVTLLVLIINLEARENPFMPTKTYQDEMARMMELETLEGDYPPEFQAKDVPEVQDVPDMPKPVAKTKKQLEAEAYAKKAAAAAAKKAKMLKMQKAAAAKKAKEEAMQKEVEELAMKKAKENPMIYVKKREDIVVDKKIDILPFINIEYTNDKLTILSKYNVFKKFYLEDENKLILDFRGKTTFYTRHYDLESKNFKKFSIGNHKEKRFFRAVIILKEHPAKYSVTYDTNMVLVTLNEEMAQ